MKREEMNPDATTALANFAIAILTIAACVAVGRVAIKAALTEWW